MQDHDLPARVQYDEALLVSALLKRTVEHILGLPLHFYAMVDMRSFRQTVDAMGWYGRTRTDSDDYRRISCQKRPMWSISRQATPPTVLRSFQRPATEFKRFVYTNLLPRFITPSRDVRGTRGSNLRFVPPLIVPDTPNLALIRRLTAQSVNGRQPGRELHDLSTSCT